MPGKFVGVVKNKNTGAAIAGSQMVFSGPSNVAVNRNASGGYQTPLINPGIYGITVTAAGYQTISDPGVALADGQTKTKNYQMTPAPA